MSEEKKFEIDEQAMAEAKGKGYTRNFENALEKVQGEIIEEIIERLMMAAELTGHSANVLLEQQLRKKTFRGAVPPGRTQP